MSTGNHDDTSDDDEQRSVPLNPDHLMAAFDRLEDDIHTGMWEHEVQGSDDD